MATIQRVMAALRVRSSASRALSHAHIAGHTRGLHTENMRVVIVGGVAGGATAAARLRRLNEHAKITVFERGPDVSFANCGLPYYIGEEIRDRSKLLLHTPGSLGKVLNVDVRANHEVVRIDPAAKVVEVRGPGGALQTAEYDKLLLSTGAAPIRPPIQGVNGQHVYVLRNMADVDAIKARVDALGGKGSVVVLGAGFIGLEAVEQMHRRGLRVTLVEARPHVLPQMDAECTTPLLDDMRGEGVTVLTGKRAAEIKPRDAARGSMVVRLESGEELDADLVLLATGVSPETGLARAAGLEVDAATRAIVVNNHMQTSNPDIYSVGDSIATPCLVDPSIRMWVPLGGPANRQARLAAEHMVLGEKADAYRGSLGTAIVRVFNTTAGMTGMTEQFLTRLGRKFETVTVSGYSHAGYYPNPHPVTVKAVYEPGSGRLLGGQVFGGLEGVDKRLDVLATAIASGAKVDDLAHLELSYAPPFGVARDVINTVGFAAQNIASGLLNPVRNLADVPSDHVLLDVRDSMSSQLKPVAGPNGRAVKNLPFDQLREAIRTGKLDKSATYATMCALGKTSYFAGRVLESNGMHAKSLVGGVSLMQEARPNPATGEPKDAPAVGTGPTSTAPASSHTVEIDACGLACPGPIMKLREALPLAPGCRLVVKASDPGFQNDVQAFAKNGNLLVESVKRERGVITAVLAAPAAHAGAADRKAQNSNAAVAETANKNDLAIVVFSGEMDRVLAALVLANGAVALGGQATLFFTFWGLSALRDDGTFPELKNGAPRNTEHEHHDGNMPRMTAMLQSALAKMLPAGAGHLPLSHMNFGGVGGKLMQHVMESKHLPSVPSLMRSAIASGRVRLVACSMSCEALGLEPSTFIPGVEVGGVADFLTTASTTKTTLFI